MPGWDDLYGEAAWRQWADRRPLGVTLEWIESLDRNAPARVFDMGCGLGRHCVVLAERGLDVVASDPSPRAREAARQRLDRSGLRASVIDSDMTSIPYPEGHFVGVLSVGVLEHNTKAGIEKAVAEIRRVLRPGGSVLASFLPRARWLPADDPEYDMLEDNTVRSWGPERQMHHMVDERELRELFAAFSIRWIRHVPETFDAPGCRVSSDELFILAEKEGLTRIGR